MKTIKTNRHKCALQKEFELEDISDAKSTLVGACKGIYKFYGELSCNTYLTVGESVNIEIHTYNYVLGQYEIYKFNAVITEFKECFDCHEKYKCDFVVSGEIIVEVVEDE